MTFNPGGMDLRPYRQPARLTRLVVEVNEPVEAVMRALVYHGLGQKAWEEVADPEITDDGDVIVRVGVHGEAYDVFARAAGTSALKVVLSRTER